MSFKISFTVFIAYTIFYSILYLDSCKQVKEWKNRFLPQIIYRVVILVMNLANDVRKLGSSNIQEYLITQRVKTITYQSYRFIVTFHAAYVTYPGYLVCTAEVWRDLLCSSIYEQRNIHTN